MKPAASEAVKQNDKYHHIVSVCLNCVPLLQKENLRRDQRCQTDHRVVTATVKTEFETFGKVKTRTSGIITFAVKILSLFESLIFTFLHIPYIERFFVLLGTLLSLVFLY